ncbi:hypothetical protein Pmani_016262 [Petrolisthes manimaculis]|uniref:Uncharacterized protein n=1 Tax=Petrolisthes manimaculis TaxID=1843537 RepID=A0AAE1PS09_9EUCA|nr:hypothetical protein Pmani_034283 [Petrolisthes manimaculis]KAK4312295.1 hypothetical protein Pmani_016262 [Petrolisthes manimaculis]
MQGLSIASLKRHPALIPLYVFLGAGVAMSALYTFRLATKNPDVSWNRDTNPEPQRAYTNKRYKFMDTRPEGNYESPAPNYME